MADDLAVLRPDEERSLEERLRQRREAERRVEALAGAHHVERRHLPLLQDVGQREAGIGVRRRDERIDVRPVLRPDVAEQVRRDRPGRGHGVAVLLVQLHAHVGVQLEIQRPHLVPQPIELLRELVGRHVVLRAPHRAGVGEAELLRALVRQLDEALVVLAHRRRDRVPAFPRGPQRLLVAGGREDVRHIVDVLARIGFGGVRAPLALAVGRLQPRHDLRQLVGLLRIRRRRQDERHLQQVQLAPLARRDLHAVVLRGLLRESCAGLVGRLVGARGDRFGVVGDVGLLHPAGLPLLGPELQRRRVGVGEEGCRVCWRRR